MPTQPLTFVPIEDHTVRPDPSSYGNHSFARIVKFHLDAKLDFTESKYV